MNVIPMYFIGFYLIVSCLSKKEKAFLNIMFIYCDGPYYRKKKPDYT